MKNPLYEELAKLAAALTSPVRLQALNLLFQTELSIDQLAEALDESPANTAAHMKALRNAGLVTAQRRGKRVFHAAANPHALRLFMALRDAGEALSPAVALLERAQSDEAASTLSIAELHDRPKRRSEIIVDLRPTTEYAAGHLPGAVSVPFDELDDHLAQLGSKRRVFVYCRGKYCPRARLGTQRARAAGVRAERLRFGVPEWVAAGNPLDQEGA